MLAAVRLPEGRSATLSAAATPSATIRGRWLDGPKCGAPRTAAALATPPRTLRWCIARSSVDGSAKRSAGSRHPTLALCPPSAEQHRALRRSHWLEVFECSRWLQRSAFGGRAQSFETIGIGSKFSNAAGGCNAPLRRNRRCLSRSALARSFRMQPVAATSRRQAGKARVSGALTRPSALHLPPKV